MTTSTALVVVKPDIAKMLGAAMADRSVTEELLRQADADRRENLLRAAREEALAKQAAAALSRKNDRLFRKNARDEAKEQAPALVKELLADLVDNLRHHGVRAAYFSTGERCDDTVGALLHMASDSYLGDGDFTEYETAISPRPWVRVPRCPYADLLEAVHGYHDALWDYRRDQFCLAIAALLQDQPLALVRYQYGIGHHNEVNDNTRDLDTFSRHQEEVHLVMLDDDGKLPPPPRPLSGYWRDGHLLTVGYLFTWREKLVKRY